MTDEQLGPGSVGRPVGTWPPEVPPFRPPGPPTEPPAPHPILPSWEEPDPRAFERDLTNRLLDERVVTLSGRLDDATANLVTSQLLLLGRKSEGTPITFHLSCGDSELGASLALADAVELAAAPVHVVAHGTLRGPVVAVLSAAASRAAHRHTLFVLSLPKASGEGTAVQLAGLAEQHVTQVAQLRRRIARLTGRPEDEIGADLEAGRLLSAEEAKAYGLVDELL
jgi:ATP-dependent Clp protease protease subunit